MAELMHVKGLKELSQALQTLPQNLVRNVLRGTVNAGASLVRDQARINAPVMEKALPGHQPPGTLKRSIVTTYVKERSNAQQVTYYVAVRQGKRYRGKGVKHNLSQDAFYATWVEFGHYYVAPKPKGITWKVHRQTYLSSDQYVPPHPFMRPAFESKKEQAVYAMGSYLANRLPAEVAKLPGASR